MNALIKAAAAFAAGAAAMYLMDPETGRRRRALVRERSGGAARDLQDSVRSAGRDARNRMRGRIAETKSHMAGDPVDDDTLHDRIHAKIGHLMDRPGTVDVQVRGGHVVLSGEAPDDEAAALSRYIAGMQGVTDVENRLSAEGGGARGGGTH
ncbi:MAG: BON domain-containing protein [Luteimonas sp.]|jgi:osmotically-inducible protein OsmY